jgi:hypothetical protein
MTKALIIWSCAPKDTKYRRLFNCGFAYYGTRITTGPGRFEQPPEDQSVGYVVLPFRLDKILQEGFASYKDFTDAISKANISPKPI